MKNSIQGIRAMGKMKREEASDADYEQHHGKKPSAAHEAAESPEFESAEQAAMKQGMSYGAADKYASKHVHNHVPGEQVHTHHHYHSPAEEPAEDK